MLEMSVMGGASLPGKMKYHNGDHDFRRKNLFFVSVDIPWCEIYIRHPGGGI